MVFPILIRPGIETTSNVIYNLAVATLAHLPFGFHHLQLPCFFLLMASIRKMSLDGHPGFDSVSGDYITSIVTKLQ